MYFQSQKKAYITRFELNPTECAKNILQPHIGYINIPINGSLISKNLFHAVIGMTTGKNSIHSLSKCYHKIPCEISLRYHLQKIHARQLIDSNNKILV